MHSIKTGKNGIHSCSCGVKGSVATILAHI